jgi:hypothetical protein
METTMFMIYGPWMFAYALVCGGMLYPYKSPKEVKIGK